MLLDLKVKKSSILLAVYLFSMFLPGYFSSPIMQMVSNIMMVGVAVYLFSVKYKPSRFMILTICYFAYLIAITFIYHNKAADVHLIISNLKIVFMLCAIEYLLKRTPDPEFRAFSGLKSNQNKKTAHHDRCVLPKYSSQIILLFKQR